ncbi:Cro/CI family transcriptional regulator [Vibrio sp. S4M6]|uniref:Cro/CI family transcriptional regulator n=1 Tax=Vibrio sinus TaxID=2946865 RepID=UPI00202AA58C|nr:Cro/CI family transcriptional regulator [Vibrio sinus]MCL9783639.1 Cro/CI family transcriptional regulator [Vibrio sinus]
MKTIEVIEFFGKKADVAKVLNTTKQAISNWGDEVPELRQYQIEVITDGEIKSDFTKKRVKQGEHK